jgi:hypothetical protein
LQLILDASVPPIANITIYPTTTVSSYNKP